MNLDEIKQAIPHRDPFLWVDEVLEITETKIRARKYLDPALALFAGHYPEFPILPGVIQCEMAFQASALLISKIVAVEDGKVPVVTRLNNTQFRRMVRPGETVEIEVEISERLNDVFFLTGKISVDGKVSTRLEFATTSAPLPQSG